jgi:hypothetical protein
MRVAASARSIIVHGPVEKGLGAVRVVDGVEEVLERSNKVWIEEEVADRLLDFQLVIDLW